MITSRDSCRRTDVARRKKKKFEMPSTQKGRVDGSEKVRGRKTKKI